MSAKRQKNSDLKNNKHSMNLVYSKVVRTQNCYLLLLLPNIFINAFKGLRCNFYAAILFSI